MKKSDVTVRYRVERACAFDIKGRPTAWMDWGSNAATLAKARRWLHEELAHLPGETFRIVRVETRRSVAEVRS